MEWIILDDGQESCKDILMKETAGLPNIRYVYLEEKLNIGAKRNMLNDLATGEIMVCMDDDDYYSPQRVSHAVEKLINNPKTLLAGSSELYIYFTDNQEIFKLGPYGPDHATNGTLAYRKIYAKTHRYDEDVIYTEEKSFLEDYINPMIQLDPFKVMLVMSHEENTFSKDFLRQKESPYIKKTNLTLHNFIADSKMINMFKTNI